MIEYVAIKSITPALLAPVINSVIAGAKKIGVKGFQKWEQLKFHTKIQKRISSIETLKTFWSADKLVSLTDFYYPSKVDIDGKTRHCQLLSELPEGNLIIEGIVGQGKSIYLRHLATSEIRSNQSSNFPIFIEFRTLSKKMDLEIAIKNYLDDVNIDGYNEETFDYVMNSGKFILLLDAFDEIEEEITKDIYLQIDKYTDKYEKLKIIITSRPSAEIQKSSKFRVIKLAPLTEIDYSPFLSKLSLSSEFIAEVKSSIKNSPSKISQLITTPLMLTLVVLAYRSVKEIPENLPDFFEVLFKCVFSGHDNAKPYIKRNLATDLSEKKLQELFETFCFVCLKSKIARSLNTMQFDNCFESAKKLLELAQCEAEDFRHDMNKVACLILPDGYDNWVFLHKSVMEYYAASFVRKSSEDFAKKFYKHAMRDPAPWMEVLTFLNYIDEYRFNKYYLLLELEAVFSELSFIKDCKDSSEIVDYLENIDGGFSVTLRFAESPMINSASLGNGKLRFCNKNIVHAPLISLLQRIIKEDKRVMDEEFFNFLKSGASPDQRASIDLRKVLKLYGDKGLIADFKIMIDRMKSKEIIAIENIRMHESRSAFLED
ncbi:MAG: NACHT domain-containing protein [Rhodoferax sp.]|nr:NACHT domain-containing protein [Rhodoferax sp.]